MVGGQTRRGWRRPSRRVHADARGRELAARAGRAPHPLAGRARSASRRRSCGRRSTRNGGCVAGRRSSSSATAAPGDQVGLVARRPRVRSAGGSRRRPARGAGRASPRCTRRVSRASTTTGSIHVCAPKSSHPIVPPPGVRLHETRRWRDDDVVAVRHPARATGGRDRPGGAVGPHRSRGGAAARRARPAAPDDRRRRRRRARPGPARQATDAAARRACSTSRTASTRSTSSTSLPSAAVAGCRNQIGRSSCEHATRARVPRRPLATVARRRRDRRHRSSAPGRWIDDSLRHNEIALAGDMVLRVPSLGLRLDPAAPPRAVERALRQAGWPPAP